MSCSVLVAISVTRYEWLLAGYALVEDANRRGNRAEIRDALSEVLAILAHGAGDTGCLSFDGLDLVARCCERSTSPDARDAARSFEDLRRAALTAAGWEIERNGL